MTESGKKLYLLHLKSLNKKLSGYGTDPYTLSYPINLSRGEKIYENVYNDMCQGEILLATWFIAASLVRCLKLKNL